MSLPNIIQQINSKLPLSGGTISGAIKTQHAYFATRDINTDRLILCGGTTSSDGAYIRLSGMNEDNPRIEMSVTNSEGTSKFLRLYPSGSLVWNNGEVITSKGGTMTDNLVFNGVANTGLRCATNTSRLSMLASNTWDSSCIHLWGSANDGNYPGCVEIIPRIGTDNYTVWRFTPEGELQKATNPIHYVVTTYVSGTNGYRIYDDGFKEQWGRYTGTTVTSATITLPYGFSNTNYMLICQDMEASSTDTEGVDYNIMISNLTTTTFRVTKAKVRQVFYYACGY